MTAQRPRYSLIERTVDSLLTAAKVSAPPVPVEEIIRAHGVAIRYSDLNDISGLVVRKDGSSVIGVNRSHSSARRRFIVAHEFGHVLLHAGKPVMFDKDFRYNLRSDLSGSGLDVEEIEANFFAASLLMPTRFLGVDIRSHSIDAEDSTALKELARIYGVSVQAIALRVVNIARWSTRSQPRLPF